MSEPVSCPRAGKWIRGCRFEGRWEYGAARVLTHSELTNTLFGDTPNALRAVRAATYVRDVCVTCGRTVEKQENAA